MTALLERIAATAPADQLVGAALRYLKEPTRSGGREYRGLARFRWLPPDRICRIPAMWKRRRVIDELDARWADVHGLYGGPARMALGRHMHNVRYPGCVMMRLVTCATVPANGGGQFDELTGVLGLSIDLDVAERRPDDRRRYCPTVDAGLDFLSRHHPSSILDCGGGLVGIWMFTEPADPWAARRLGGDLVAAFDRATRQLGWAFDSPTPHAAWIKVPTTFDYFHRREVAEIFTGDPWPFTWLRSVVAPTPRRPSRRPFYNQEAVS